MLLETRRIWWLVGALTVTVAALFVVVAAGTTEPRPAAAASEPSRPNGDTAIHVLTARRSLPVDGCLRFSGVGARWAPC